MKTNMYKVTFVNETGKKSLIIDETHIWMSKGNFAGMGQFTKLKIKKIVNK